MAINLRDKSEQDIDPLTHDLNNASSWGLEFPLVFGWRPDRDMWMVWDRNTGKVAAFAPHDPNTHGWCNGKYLCRDFSQPGGHDPITHGFPKSGPEPDDYEGLPAATVWSYIERSGVMCIMIEAHVDDIEAAVDRVITPKAAKVRTTVKRTIAKWRQEKSTSTKA